MRIDDGGYTDPNGLQVTGQSSGGNGFQFSAAELRKVLAGWQNLHDQLDALKSQAQPMIDVTPGASDQASDAAASVAGYSGAAYYGHLTAMSNYADAYITALSAALKNYSESEEAGRHSAASVNTDLQ